MKALLQALKGARIVAQGMCDGRKIIHYLLPCGKVLEIVF